MKITSAQFLKGAHNASQYPVHKAAEFAFFGKSNTGKSSLINMVTGRNGLVKTGSRPGLTQAVNFFMVNESFCLVDLPGIGYSQLPGEVRKGLLPMIREYCVSRENLRAIFYLLDLRREVGADELETLAQLRNRGVPVVIVGTKEDKLGRNDLHKTIHKWAQIFQMPPEELCITSAEKRVGKERLLACISKFLH